MGIEVAAAKIGQAVASHAAKSWLTNRRKHRDRTESLAQLAAHELAKPHQIARLEHLVEGIGHQVTEQLEPVLQRSGSLPDNEIEAALTAVVDALNEIDLSDDALLADDADPEVLARRIRRQVPFEHGPASRLYDLALDQACRYLVQVIRHLPSFQPRALAEVLGRASAQAAQLDEVLARLPRTSLHAPQGTGNDNEFREEYLRYVASTLDRLELLGLSMKHRPRLALSVAYLSLTVSEQHRKTREERLDAAHWFGGNLDRGPRHSVRVEAAIGRSRRTLVRGEAGSGKTTLLDWLAVTAARAGFTGQLSEWNGSVPFAVRLRRYADSPLPRPEQFLDHAASWLAGLMPRGWVHRALRSGQALLLVDGVDEVPMHRRRLVRDWLRELIAAFPDARVVVTARPAAADQRWLTEEGFSSVHLEQMSPGDVRVFLRRWHQAASKADSLPCPPDQLPEAERRLLSQLNSRAHLRALASNPLLCAMLCALNLGRTSELPSNRMDLYQAALTMLLDLRDAERQIAGLLTASQKTVLLRDLAWRLTLANRSELPRERVRAHIARKLPSMPGVHHDIDVVVTHLLERSGVMREPVPGRVDFLHRTFQEYLAAEEATEDGQIETLVSHAHLDAWWETIVMACGHAQRTQVGELLTQILDRADREAPPNARRLRLLAAACLETVQDIDPGVHQRIDTTIRERLAPPRSTKESRSLASIGHRMLRYLPETLDDLSEASAAATVRAAALTASPEALSRLARYAQDKRGGVKQEIINAWEYFDPQRYADEVMPFVHITTGHLTVRVKRLVPFASRLPQVSELSVRLPEHERIDDLRFLTNATQLIALHAYCAGDIDLTPLSEVPHIGRLALYDGVFRGVHVLPKLQWLALLDLGPLKPLSSIRFVRELTRLRRLGLRRLDAVTDYEPLKHLTELDTLVLQGCRQLHNLRYLLRMELEVLDLSGCELPDLCTSIATEFPALRQLGLYWCPVTDLAPLGALRGLRNLFLSEGREYKGLDKLSPSTRIFYRS